MLASTNAQRVAQGQQTFADVNAMSTDILTQQILSWIQAQKETEALQVKQAFLAANNQVQNQVKTDLGL